MSARTKFHISPDGANWKFQKEGTSRPSKVFDNKSDAVSQGTGIAKKQGHSQVIIHKKDGTIQEERTYDKDPYPPKG